MDGLPVDTFPEVGTLVVGEGVEEGFAECGVWVHLVPFLFEVVVVVGIGWRGVGTPFGVVVAVTVMMMVMAVGVPGVLRCG